MQNTSMSRSHHGCRGHLEVPGGSLSRDPEASRLLAQGKKITSINRKKLPQKTEEKKYPKKQKKLTTKTG